MTDPTNIQYLEYCIDVHGQNEIITMSTATVPEIGTGNFVYFFGSEKFDLHTAMCTDIGALQYRC